MDGGLLSPYLRCFAVLVLGYAVPLLAADSKDSLRHPVKVAPEPIRIKIEKPLAYLKWEQGLYSLKPPAPSSARTKKEIGELLNLQQRRTADSEKQAVDQEKQSLQSNLWVARTLKFAIGPQQFPATVTLLDNALSDVESVCFRLALKYGRPSPEQLENKIKSLVKLEPEYPHFPSLPSCRSYMQSMILSALYPDGRDSFSANAYDVVKATEMAGTHFHSDNEAAQEVVMTAFNEMLKSPRFLADFAKAKSEWTRFRK